MRRTERKNRMKEQELNQQEIETAENVEQPEVNEEAEEIDVEAKGDAVKSIAGEIVKVRNTLRILERNRVIDRKFELLAELEALSVKYAWR